jgi:poly(beta-D-mannuronate) lyase
MSAAKNNTFRKKQLVLAAVFCGVIILAIVIGMPKQHAATDESPNVKKVSSAPDIADNQVPTSPSEIPAKRLDLGNWKLTLPVDANQDDAADEIKQPGLATFRQVPYFTTNADGVVFRAQAGGATTENSGYPRSELREMTKNGTKKASWSNASGTHTMFVKQAITHLPDVKPELVAGQIHDDSDDVVMIRLEKNHLFVEANGKNIGDMDANYQLGTFFIVKIVAESSQINVFYNDVLKVTYDKAGSGYYFKAGCYTQSNTGRGDTADAYGEVVISELKISHT